jgi:phenylacetate-CoA ligase
MLESIYLNIPVPLQSLAISVLGARNRASRYGPAFRSHNRFLTESEYWCEERILNWQNQQLLSLLNHAFTTVPYFRRLAPKGRFGSAEAREVLRGLPWLEKRQIRDGPSEYSSESFRSRDLLSVVTSGTTGSPVRFLIDKTSRQYHFAYFARLLRWAGLDERSWHAVFMGRMLGTEAQVKRQPWRVDHANRRVYYSSYHITHEGIAKYADHLQRREPEWIEGYPSAIGNLARLSIDRGFDLPKPRAIIPSSETLDDVTRTAIQAAFGDAIWEFYGAAEQAAFISQCDAGSLHINPEYGIVEFEPRGHDQDGLALYEMIATSFRNLAMPLLRYRTDDLVTKGPESCSCGRSFPRVHRIVGRESGAVVLPDGRRVTGVSNIPKGLPIEKSQLVQMSKDALEFHVVPIQHHWGDDVERTVLGRLRDRLGSSVNVCVRTVADIPPGPNGKTPLVKGLPRSITRE